MSLFCDIVIKIIVWKRRGKKSIVTNFNSSSWTEKNREGRLSLVCIMHECHRNAENFHLQTNTCGKIQHPKSVPHCSITLTLIEWTTPLPFYSWLGKNVFSIKWESEIHWIIYWNIFWNHCFIHPSCIKPWKNVLGLSKKEGKNLYKGMFINRKKYLFIKVLVNKNPYYSCY